MKLFSQCFDSRDAKLLSPRSEHQLVLHENHRFWQSAPFKDLNIVLVHASLCEAVDFYFKNYIYIYI